jgi:hypothetical protein
MSISKFCGVMLLFFGFRIRHAPVSRISDGVMLLMPGIFLLWFHNKLKLRWTIQGSSPQSASNQTQTFSDQPACSNRVRRIIRLALVNSEGLSNLVSNVDITKAAVLIPYNGMILRSGRWC